MVGINKWSEEQIAMVFDLYHKEGLRKYQIADKINSLWPRRGATSAGVNYVLNTKKKQFQ